MTGKPVSEQEQEQGPFKGRRMDTVMGAVLTVAVAIVAMCVLKRPQAVAGVMRRAFARA